MSEPVLLHEEFILAIDTDSFSQDFRSDLVAYCTGFVDEASVSDRHSEMFYEEMRICDGDSGGPIAEERNPFAGYIVDREDENGDLSPCCSLLNKSYLVNEAGEARPTAEADLNEYPYPAPFSVGIFFGKRPEDHHVRTIRSRAERFFADVWGGGRVAVEGYRLIIHKKYGEEVSLD